MAENAEDLVSRARQQFGSLEPSEELLCRAAAKGELADYRVGSAAIDNPIHADQWGAGRILRAGLIRWLCATSKLWNSLGNGRIEILGGKIVGELKLDHIAIDAPLRFCHCNFTEPILLRNGRLRTLDLTGTHVSSITADEVRVEGSVYLRNGFQAKGTVSFYASKIDGNLDCRDGHFINIGSDALVGSSGSFGGEVLLCGDFRVEGRIAFLLATIRGNLDCSGGQFSNPGGKALEIDGTSVMGSVFLRSGAKAEGAVSLYGVSIGGNLDCDRGHFINPKGVALGGERAQIKGYCLLINDFRAEGSVRLGVATVGVNLDCGGGHFISESDPALFAAGAKVVGDVRLSDNFEAKGGVDLFGVTVGGSLVCAGETNGTVDLRNAVIGADLNCKRGHFANPGKDSLTVARARIGGAVFLSSDFQAEGKVNFDNSRVNGDFRCSKGVFMNEHREAFTAKGAQIAGNLFLNNGFRPAGNVDLRRLRVDGRLTIDAISDQTNSDNLDLRFAQVTTLNHNWRDWPKAEHLFLNGFTYSALGERFLEDREEMEERPFDAGDQIRANVQPDRMPDVKWLRLQPKERFRLQPYEQLAKVLRSNGDESAAKRVLIAKQDDLRRYGNLRWWAKCWNWLLGFTIRHGYEPHRALVGMLFFVLLGWGIFGWAYDNKLMSRTIDITGYKDSEQGDPYRVKREKEAERDYPKFNRFVYSLDAFLPIVDLKEKSYWLPNANKSVAGRSFRFGAAVRIYLWIHIIFGWILTTLWVAGFSGLVRSGNKVL